jgi:integrase
MRRVFNHAITYEWLKQGENPMKHVHQSAKRQKEPDPFEPDEIQRLLSALESPHRVMVLVVLSFGLRCSELFALQWRDFDFEHNVVTIARNICYGRLGECKTQASRATLPMLPLVAIALSVWRKFTPYDGPEDWVFPSTYSKGKTPPYPGGPMNDFIKPAAIQAGITKRVHWHAFRYTFGTWLVASGADIAVVHELMRHASPRTTLEFYIKARKTLKIKAQNGIQGMLFPGAEASTSFLEHADLPDDVRKKQRHDALDRIAPMIYGSERAEATSEPDEAQINDDQDHPM